MHYHHDASYLIQTHGGPQRIAASYDDKRGVWVATLPELEVWLYPVADTSDDVDGMPDDIDSIFEAPLVWQGDVIIGGYCIPLTIGAGAAGPMTADIVATDVARQLARYVDIAGVLGGAHD